MSKRLKFLMLIPVTASTVKRALFSLKFVKNNFPCDTVVQWLSLLHNFIQQRLNSSFAHVQILPTAFLSFAMVKTSENASDKLLDVFRTSNIL